MKPRTASKSAAIIAGIVIGAGLLMTSCSSAPVAAATKACTLLADA